LSSRDSLYQSAIKRFEEIFPEPALRWKPFSLIFSQHFDLGNCFRPAQLPRSVSEDQFEEITRDMHVTYVYGWGQDIFAGDTGESIREAVLMELFGLEWSEGEMKEKSNLSAGFKQTRNQLFRNFSEIYDVFIEDVNFQDAVKMAKMKKWVSGKTGAKKFCKLTGFDEFFAGEISEPPPGHFDILPWVEYPPMRDYQEEISELMAKVLQSQNPDERQGILVLPTGAGKTRIAVETVLRWYLKRDKPPLIVWLCHRNELCEQASLSFENVWNRISIDGTENPFGRNLRIFRFWGNIWTNSEDGQDTNPINRNEGGIAILSIQTLQQITVKDTIHHSDVRERLKDPECIIVDEVHRFESKGYRDALSGIGVDVRLKRDFQETRIGLTATPWRSDVEQQERMYRRWSNRFLLGDIVGKQSNPEDVEMALNRLRKSLQDEKILAKPNYFTLSVPDPNTEVKVDKYREITSDSARKLAENRDRNLRILYTIEWLRKERGRKSILLFGITKEHGRLMSIELNSRGIPSASVDAESKPATRRGIVAKFRTGELDVLCNHSIFTTGFDAPNTDAIVICRPVRSKTLLDQIFGRGLRGTQFGGTEDCDIVVPDYKFKFRSGGTRTLETFAVPQKEIEKMLGANMEHVPSNDEE
jgi:DNA repair protein RadD